MNIITTISSSVLSSGWFHMVTTYMCVLSHCLYLMETNLSQIIVYNPMGEFFIYIYIYILGGGGGYTLWSLAVDLLLQGLCDSQPKWLLQDRENYMTRPKDNLFAKAWFSYFGKISGDQVFLFFLTISDFVDILDSHQNSFADFTDIELVGNGR